MFSLSGLLNININTSEGLIKYILNIKYIYNKYLIVIYCKW